MRKIEKDMVTAASAGKPLCKSNTTVTVDGDKWTVSLFGNPIAKGKVGYLTRPTEINLCGWNSTSTRSRLRAFGLNITSKKGVVYLDGKKIPTYGWVKVN